MAEDFRELKLEQGCFCWRELGKGPPLVMLHGWSMSHAVFNELADLLAADFRLLIPDLPGHGSSALVDPCSLDSMAQILETWFEQLDLTPIALLGWSLGGQLAMQLSVNCPQRIERLLLFSSTPCFCATDDWSAGLPEGELRALRRGLQRRYQATMGEFFDLQFADEDLSVERRREILQFAVRPVGLPEAETALKTLDILGKQDLRPLLKCIELPTLVVHGELDRIIPHAAGSYLAETLLRARLVSLPDVGHAPFLSKPEAVAQLLKDFCT